MKWLLMITFVVVTRVSVAGSFAGPCEWSESAPSLYEMNLGVLAHDVGKLWSHSRRERGIDYNAEVTFAKPSCPLFWGRLRPNVGVSINDNGDTSKVYAGVILEWLHRNGLFFKLGLGGAIHDGKRRTRQRDKKALGSRVLFRFPVELGLTVAKRHRVSVLFDHVSNGYLAEPNEGLDTIGMRYGYRF